MDLSTTPWGPLGLLPATCVREVICVRHGQTTANADGILQGWLDYPLTPLGLAQVRQTAEAMADWRIEAIYSSPLGRARRTAELLAAGQVPVETVPGLMEVHAGGVTGRTWAEFAQVHPQAWADYRAATGMMPAYHKAMLPGWEPPAHVVYRVWQALGAILAAAVVERIMLVSHGDVLSALLTQWLDGDALRGDWRYPQANCAVSRIALDAQGPRLVGGVQTLYQVAVT